MTKRRANLTDRLAASYLQLGLVPEPLASQGTAKQIVAYIEADHNFPHALGGDTRPQNLNLLAKDVHAAKTAKDRKAIAKSNRLAMDAKETLRKMFAKAEGLQLQGPRLTRKGNLPLPCGRYSGWKKPFGKLNAIRRITP